MQQFAAREVGQRIAQARQEAGGMTQVELAEALDVSQRQLQNFEAGVTIPWKYFTRLEQIFGRPLPWFLHGEERPSNDGVSPLLTEAMVVAVEALRQATAAVVGTGDLAVERLAELRPLLEEQRALVAELRTLVEELKQREAAN